MNGMSATRAGKARGWPFKVSGAELVASDAKGDVDETVQASKPCSRHGWTVALRATVHLSFAVYSGRSANPTVGRRFKPAPV